MYVHHGPADLLTVLQVKQMFSYQHGRAKNYNSLNSHSGLGPCTPVKKSLLFLP